MKVRLKYSKTGPLKFISHLDVMRFFQKAIRRAEFDIKYSGGFSPHQLISFAAPMPLMLTSVGEYCDAEFNSVTNTEEMVRSFNEVSTEYMQLIDVVILPDDAKNSMSVVTASDYEVTLTDEGKDSISMLSLIEKIDDMIESDEVLIMKKTKKNEKITNIRPSIFKLSFADDKIYMMVSAGSVDNLKPELVIESLCKMAGIDYNRYHYDILRIDTYMTNEANEYVPLSEAGHRF